MQQGLNAITKGYFVADTAGFAYVLDDFKQLVSDVLGYAKQQGATAAEAEVSEGVGHNVSVRLGETETIEYNRDKGISITVYAGQAKGHASTADLNPAALRATVDAALNIARFTAADPAAGLAEPAHLATDFRDLDLFSPWAITVEESLALAGACEAAALQSDSRIRNSEGGSLSTQQSQFIYGNTHGFLAGYPSSRHALSCSVIAGEGDAMQRDYWYDSRRDMREMDTAAEIGRVCGARTVRRLDGRKIDTGTVPILFDATIAAGLIGHFVQAVSGGSLYREASFLTGSMGKAVFAPHVQLVEVPWLPKAFGSAMFDDEGVATQQRVIVDAGVVQGYFLSTYTARKLGMTSTGNSGGAHNLRLHSTGEDFAALLRKMDRGLWVTELMGQGVNIVTGDYSRGAAGFWVENGVVQYPVHEITIAGQLQEMFKGIVAVGTDVFDRSSRLTGSILVDRMMVAGN